MDQRSSERQARTVDGHPVVARAVAPTVLAQPVSAGQALQRRLGNAGVAALLGGPDRRAETVGNVTATSPSLARSPAGRRMTFPTDPCEREAEAVAKRVMAMRVEADEPPRPSARTTAGAARLARAPAAAGGAPDLDPQTAQELEASRGGGTRLPLSIRTFMERRFHADFSGVRIHTDEKAGRLAMRVSARAFAYGNDIYFARGAYSPDTQEGGELIAHELTHTIQQRAVVQRDVVQRAAIQGQRGVTVTQAAPATVQRFGIDDVLDYFADKANLIPGFRMFTIVLGVNPINMSRVERSGANILRALVEFIPGGKLITDALDQYGVFERAGGWVEQQFHELGMTVGAIKKAVDDFLDSLGWRDVFHLGEVWDRAKRIFTDPIDRIVDFVGGLVGGIVDMVKEAILRPLAKLAEGTRGWDLLIAILGRNPITGDPVPQTAETLIGGFMKLIGQEEVWDNIKKANALPRAWAWFKGALSALLGFVQQIPSLFVSALKSLEIIDIVVLPKAFIKVAAVFGNFIGNFISWAGNAVWNLLEIVFQVVSPRAWEYIQRTGAALKSILRNPIPFVLNLVKSAKLGFENFATNIGTHLKAGLIDWLTGSLPGIYIPKAFSLIEIGKFVLSVLGITWGQIRGKIVKALGPTGERIMAALETGFDIVVALVKGGPAAAWELIKEKLSDLKDTVIGGITSFVTDIVVKKAIPKLISLFVPGAGFISAILSIYDTIKVFIEKISKIVQVVVGFIDSIVAIASGAIGVAATRVENTLAGLISLAISFFAGFVGLGNVAEKVIEILQKVRAGVDKAIDAAIAWVIGKAKALFTKLFGKGDKKDERTEQEKQQNLDSALKEAAVLQHDPKANEADIAKRLTTIKNKYRMSSLILIEDSSDNIKATIHVEGKINPSGKTPPTSIPKNPNIEVRFNRGRHTLAGVIRANSPNKVDNTILMELVDVPAVKQAALLAYLASPKDGGDFTAEDVQWRFDRLGPKDDPTKQYLHIYPTHSPPKAINLSRAENKAVKTYQENRQSGKDHDAAMKQVQDLAKKLPGAFDLSSNVLLVIEAIK
jgi:hypothetical protein